MLSIGEYPDFSILDFRQLQSVIEVMNEDVKFIDSKDVDFQNHYRTHINELPSSKRIKVGLLQDDDGINQIDKFWKTGVFKHDLQFNFIPLNLDEPYELWGKMDIIVQKL